MFMYGCVCIRYPNIVDRINQLIVILTFFIWFFLSFMSDFCDCMKWTKKYSNSKIESTDC